MKSRLTCIGEILKPHGINGEMAATISPDVDTDVLKCIFLLIDGLYVPFFIEGLRHRGSEAVLLTIDGIDDEKGAKELARKEIFILKDDPAAPRPDDDDSDGFYADDLTGFTAVTDDGTSLGTITGIDDSTINVLFIIERPDGSEALVPVADEFITDIDPDKSIVTMTLPDGLIP